MHLMHLIASTMYGGPERQILGLSDQLIPEVQTTIASFSEGGRCQPFLDRAASLGHGVLNARYDTPHFRASISEIADELQSRHCDILICHGYKANLLGRWAAHRIGIPAIAVSRGWTWENAKVRLYEWLDRRHLRFMDHVVCVSHAQAKKVLAAGVPSSQVSVIHNSARLDAFCEIKASVRWHDYFPNQCTLERIILAAGRLSPEKGFDVLVEAAQHFLHDDPKCGVVLFGEGAQRAVLEVRIRQLGLQDRFRMPGHIGHLDSLLPSATLLVLPSFTEGLPNVVLEASAAGLPVVATAVGGTPECIDDGHTGYLVPPGNPEALAHKITTLLSQPSLCRSLGQAGRKWVASRFSFSAQAGAYLELFQRLTQQKSKQHDRREAEVLA